MNITIISDVHIRNRDEKYYQKLLDFLACHYVASSDMVIFLGDIFDLMIGPHDEYFKQFPEFFNALEELIKKGKKIIYFEGNHDFHLKKLYLNFLNERSLDKSKLLYKKKSLRITVGENNVHMSHGDDIEIGNISYKIYKFLINNFVTSFLANYIVPYGVVHFIGERASKKSRKRNVEYYGTEEAQSIIKESFRKAASIVSKKRGDNIIICGHSHVKDDFISSEGFRYINNGIFKRDNSIIFISNSNIEQVVLD